MKRLAELEKDNARDVQIPIPSKSKDGGARSKGKTGATRKILTAQKTFANYLADEEAMATIEAPTAAASIPRRTSTAQRPTSQLNPKDSSEDMPMADAPEEEAHSTKPVRPRPASDGLDDSRLLECVIPKAPSDALMEALTSAPPLSYSAARVGPSTSGRPPLHFCEMCGYWGNYKCRLCGGRYCGLACKTKHDADCQKYGLR